MSHCKACDNQRAAAWAAVNKDRTAEHSAKYQRDNRGTINLRAKAARAESPETQRAYVAKWRAANVEVARAASRAWYAANPARSRAQEAKRRSAKLNAVPALADHDQIARIYSSARELREVGIDVHVDHIIPLQGKAVRGLHTHDNLQIILAKDNIAKSNRTEV